MKLIIKNLKQVPHEVEVPSDAVTVKDLKVAIEQKHGFDSNQLKLLFNGVVLDDTKTLASYNIKNEFVIIMMNTKIKPKNVPVPQPEQPKPQEVPKTTTEVPKPQEPKPVEQPKPVAPPKDYSKEVQTLVEMGFVKSEAEAAIKAAKGNVDIAVEFLYSGIPQNLPEDPLPGQEGQTGPRTQLQKLASIFKVLCSQDPSALERILHTLQQTSPETMNLIKENEEEFKNLLTQPLTQEDINDFQEMQSMFTNIQQGGAGMGGGSQVHPGARPGTVQIRLTKEEAEAVKRLMDLGFTQSEVIQAYLACDKNEEYAANFLFENRMEDTHMTDAQIPQQPPVTQPQVPSQPQSSSQPQQPSNEEPKKEEEKKNEEEKK